MRHHAAAPAHAGHMHFAHPGKLDDGTHVIGIDPRPRHQAGSPRQRLLHRLQIFQPGQRGRCMTGAENALAAGSDNDLQIEPPVRREIDGAVEGDTQRAGGIHQLLKFGGGDPPLLIQQTNHDPLQTGRAGHRDILPHHLELTVVETKISGARTDHGIDRDGGVTSGQLHKTIGGGQPPKPQSRAELDAIGASLLGGEEGFQIVDADFKRGHEDSFFGEIRPHI